MLMLLYSMDFIISRFVMRFHFHLAFFPALNDLTTTLFLKKITKKHDYYNFYKVSKTAC